MTSLSIDVFPTKMDQNSRINSVSTPVVRNLVDTVQTRHGTLDGVTLTVLRPEDDVDEQIETSYRRQALGLDGARPQLQISQMKIDVSDKSQQLSRLDAQQYLRALGQTKSSANLAQEFLQRLLKGVPLPPKGKSSLEIAEFHAALQRIDAALKGTDSEFVG